MKYLLIYYTESKYLHFVKRNEKEFKYLNDLRSYLINNIHNIKQYDIYKLTDLSNK
jgi:hypothetical protein